VVQARAPEFQVQSNDGKLVPNEGAPEAATRAPKSLRTAERWRGIALHAGPEGVAIQRQPEGTDMWSYDLQLAPYLLDEIKGGKEVALLQEEEFYAYS